jgi:spermidine/putrescine-binding protein
VNDRHDGSSIDLERELIRVMAEGRLTRRQLLERMGALGVTVALAPIVAACSAVGGSASPSASALAAVPSATPSATAQPTATPSPTPQPTPEKDLIVYNWDSYIADTTQKAFEDKYGI